MKEGLERDLERDLEGDLEGDVEGDVEVTNLLINEFKVLQS